MFGSVGRGDDHEKSDIDFLVDFEPGSSHFDLLHLHEELTALRGFPVDVVSRRALKDRDEHIRREAGAAVSRRDQPSGAALAGGCGASIEAGLLNG